MHTGTMQLGTGARGMGMLRPARRVESALRHTCRVHAVPRWRKEAGAAPSNDSATGERRYKWQEQQQEQAAGAAAEQQHQSGAATKASRRWEEERREVAARDIDMTGGVGDYIIPPEPQEPDPFGANTLREVAGAVTETWFGPAPSKGEMIGLAVVTAVGLFGASLVSDLIHQVPLLPSALRFVGVWVTGFTFWRYLMVKGGVSDLAHDVKEARSSMTASATTMLMRGAEGAAPPHSGQRQQHKQQQRSSGRGKA